MKIVGQRGLSARLFLRDFPRGENGVYVVCVLLSLCVLLVWWLSSLSLLLVLFCMLLP